jgi:hypothetical protein
MNRRMPNGTYGGVRGWGRKAPAYSISAMQEVKTGANGMGARWEKRACRELCGKPVSF